MDHGQMGGGMTRGHMMMGQMMAKHQEMSEIMSKMMQSMAAINTEKDRSSEAKGFARRTCVDGSDAQQNDDPREQMHDMAGKMKSCGGMGEVSK